VVTNIEPPSFSSRSPTNLSSKREATTMPSHAYRRSGAASDWNRRMNDPRDRYARREFGDLAIQLRRVVLTMASS
jgi:hypothetical protein